MSDKTEGEVISVRNEILRYHKKKIHIGRCHNTNNDSFTILSVSITNLIPLNTLNY